jgi:S-DNA-T family DNA segregation ATPase FtsK/SpoIIIE
MRQNIGCGIGLQLPDRFAYETILGMKTDIVAESRIPGRGLICYPKPLEFQTALCLPSADAVTFSRAMKVHVDEMARAWSGERAPAIPQVPADMTLNSLLETPSFTSRLTGGRYLPLGYSLSEAALEHIDLVKTFCFSISGTEQSGKTNLLKALARLAKEQGSRVYLFDSPNRELEDFSSRCDLDAYLTDAEALYRVMETVMVPEFTRRNANKVRLLGEGRKRNETYLPEEQKIFLFIHDMTAFCETVYQSQKDMRGFMELMISHGHGHMIYLFACVTPVDVSGAYGNTRFLRGFTGYRDGIHLGGDVERQRIFLFDLPILERVKKRPAGYGHIISGGITKQILTPEA